MKQIVNAKKFDVKIFCVVFLLTLFFCLNINRQVNAVDKEPVNKIESIKSVPQYKNFLLSNFKKESETITKEDNEAIEAKLKKGELDKNQYNKAKELIECRNKEFEEFEEQIKKNIYINGYDEAKKVVYEEFEPYINFFKQYKSKPEVELKFTLEEALHKSYVIIETKNEIRNRKLIEKNLLNSFYVRKISLEELNDRIKLLNDRSYDIFKIIGFMSGKRATQDNYEKARDEIIENYKRQDFCINQYYKELRKITEDKNNKFLYIKYLHEKTKTINAEQYLKILNQYQLVFSYIGKYLNKLKEDEITLSQYSEKLRKVEKEYIVGLDKNLLNLVKKSERKTEEKHKKNQKKSQKKNK